MSNAIKMDLDEVFVSAEEAYHNTQRICVAHHQVSTSTRDSLLGIRWNGRTMSLGDMGARSASAISWAFWLTLPLRPLIVRMASVRLFWRLCPRDAADQPLSCLETGSHRSEGRGGAPFAQPGGFGGPSEGDSPRGVSTKSGNFSITGQ